jgi:hypothetical protein
VCFGNRLFESLRAIADDLGSDTDPALLRKVGDFFMSNSQYDKAVHLFITCKQPGQARSPTKLPCSGSPLRAGLEGLPGA